MANKNTIELNGQKYDTLTGAALSQKQQIDGFIKAKPKPAIKVVKPMAKAPQPASRAKPNPHHAHRPHHSTTLMRTGVNKPSAGLLPIRQVQAPAGSEPVRRPKSGPQVAALDLDEHRLAHATQIHRSPAVRHFHQTRDMLGAKLEALPVRLPSALPKPSRPPTKAAVDSSSAKLDKLLAGGLAQANSHELPLLTKPPKAVSRRKSSRSARQRRLKPLLAIGLLLAVAIAIAGFLFYQFLPRIDLNLASTKSGVHAVLPSYKPAGFSFVTPVKYAAGIITLSYRQKSTGKQFNLTEQNSSWDSQTLLDSFVAPTDPNYQTQQKNNQTFYIYNQTNTTWVNGGIWFQIGGSANLSSGQLLAIAAGL